MKGITILVMLLFFTRTLSIAQTIQISGKLIGSEDGLPVKGASVKDKTTLTSKFIHETQYIKINNFSATGTDLSKDYFDNNINSLCT